MSRNKSTPWVLGAAFLCVVLFAMSWLLLVSPRLTAAAETRDQVTQAQTQNEILRAKTAVLREQFANLDQFRSDLAAVRTQIPAEPRLAEAIRTIEALALEHEVMTVAVQANDAVDVVPVMPTPVEPPAAEPEAGDGGEAGSDEGETGEEVPAAPPTPVGPVPIEGFVAVPVTVTVLGPGPNVQTFIGALQTDVDRLVLVHTLSGTAAVEADENGGRPATAIGDLEMTITGYLYVLTDDTVVAEEGDGATEQPPLPTAPTGKNPFAPNTAGSGGGGGADESSADD